jgi:septal ring factor EnvC (AmiA/AmiB activator)
MAPAAGVLCNFHEQRLNDLEEEISSIRTEQAKIDTKLDSLTSHVQELKTEVSQKLDRLLDKTDGIVGVAARVASLEKSGDATKKIALKIIPPVGMALIGLAAGAGGESVMKFILSLFGG